MDILSPFSWTINILAVALVFQSVELLVLRRQFSDSGTWRWGDLKREFADTNKLSRLLADFLLPYNNFVFLLNFRLVSAALIPFIPHPALFGFLLLSTLFIAARFRGSFNGGSDYMTVVILSALFVASLFPKNLSVLLGCAYYISLQSTLSYLISGFKKLLVTDWFTGQAPTAFLKSSILEMPVVIGLILDKKNLVKILSWVTILFECSFPLALLHPDFCLMYISFGFFFHLANAYLLGLNRFFWVWIATYPMLYWCSGLN